MFGVLMATLLLTIVLVGSNMDSISKQSSFKFQDNRTT